MAEIENLKIGNGGTLHIVGNEDVVANSWEAGKTYVKNKSYVIREHRLYVCNVTHTSVEPFDATKWTEITIGDAIGNNIGDLSQLTTSVKSSLVGAVNEVNGNLPKQVYKNLNWETVHSFVAEVNTLYLLTADSGNDLAIARLFSNGVANLGVVSGSKITGISYENGRLKVSTNNCGMIAIRIA